MNWSGSEQARQYIAVGVVGAIVVVALFGLWWLSTSSGVMTIEDDLAAFPEVGERVMADFNAYPLVSLTDEYSLTDTLKDGVAITYGNHSTTTFSTPDASESLSLAFPEDLREPLEITLPGDRVFTVTHNVEGEYTSEFLTAGAVDLPQTADLQGALSESQSLLEADTTAPTLPRVTLGRDAVEAAPSYLKYTSPDERVHTYYAYQKDQAQGYRNLKHWTIFTEGDGHETQSYTFSNAHLTTNDRGEVEVRYLPTQTTPEPGVSEDLWARAQRVLAADRLADIENRTPDLIIPAPFTIDAQGTHVTHEWVVTTAEAVNPADTSGDYILSVSFEVPLLGYPIALDPTLQFTAPGTSNSGDVIDGTGFFGVTLATGDWNGDGREDLAISAAGYNSFQGRVYIFHGASNLASDLTGADVVLTGEAASDIFGAALASGDFNDDGTEDLIVGATRYGSDQGRAYIFYGGSMVSENASNADVIITGEGSDDRFGLHFTAGDFNNDGTEDIAVASSRYNSNQGRVYVFYNDGSIPTAAGSADVIFTGNASDRFGWKIATGDLNADGTNDLIVGAIGHDSLRGRTYIFYNDGSYPTTAATADVTITGRGMGNNFGGGLAVGDFNADGTDDLAVGAYNRADVYVFYGGSLGASLSAGVDEDVNIDGYGSGGNFGGTMTVGDLNSDGIDDLVIGQFEYDFSTLSNEGLVHIIYGGNLPASISASTETDVTIRGEFSTYFGYRMAVGDLNNDGKDDLVVGGPYYNSWQGRAYIFYSQSGQVNLNDHITGEGTGDYFGSAFAVGDFNNDGRDDLAVSAYQDNSNTGKVYIFYNDGDYTDLASTSDVIITGEGINNNFGIALAVGDISGDGRDDLIVGANNYNSQGRVYIFYSDGAFPASAANDDHTIDGTASAQSFGHSIGVGDFDNDGTDDLAITDPETGWGRLLLFYNDGSLPTTMTTADVTVFGSDSSGTGWLGQSVATGDFDGDGDDDLIVGDHQYGAPSYGQAYVIFNDGSYPTAASGADIIITGPQVLSNYFGYSVMSGDINADGIDDMIFGAPLYNNDGRVFIFFGSESLSSTSAESADVVITGDGSGLGLALESGDFNNDGRDDLAVGARLYNSSQGRVYLYYGGTFTASMEAATSSSVMITGDSANDDFGYALVTGDFNADGKDDLVIGAPGYDTGSDTGRIYFYETREDYAWEIQRSSLSDGVRVDPLMGYELKITGETTGNGFTTAIEMADLNNDGKDDLIVGASGYNSSQGKVYIFYNDGNYPTKAGRADVTITGENTGDFFGISIVTGDFNNDGKPDLSVGAHGYTSFTGCTYLFFGALQADATAATADVILTGESAFHGFGSVQATGDYNHDGVDDLAVRASGYDVTINEGRVYVFYGDITASKSASLADVAYTGEAATNFLGTSLATADLNSDGVDDLIVTTDRYSTNTGRVYTFYGGSLASTTVDNADLILTGEATNNFFGGRLAVGDFNSDGKDDVAAAANQYNTSQGRVYTFYGGSLASTTANNADTIYTGEAANHSFGSSLTTGDLNVDGVDDLAVGASGYDAGASTNDGRAYIFYSTSTPGSRDAADADVILTGEGAGDRYGSTLFSGDLNNDGTDDLLVGATNYNSSQGRLYFYTTNDRHYTGEGTDSFLGSSFAVGDFNNDGKNDLAVGATGYNSNQGRTYIFYGGSKATTSAAGADVMLTGEAASNKFGSSLTTGDFNHDGKDDLAVGAYSHNSSTGRVYLFYGDGSIPTTAASADVILTGEASSRFGISLTTGDLNADGTDDLAVGAFRYNSWQGRAYIFYGGSLASSSAASADVVLTGEVANDSFGSSLTTGDLNADGKADLAVGAPGYDAGVSNANYGRVYIFHGGSIASGTAASADVTITGSTNNELLGNPLMVGDWNADGRDDLAAGATGYGNDTGRVYLLNGPLFIEEAISANVHITGEGEYHYFGGVLLAGDLSGNGIDDLIIGAEDYGDITSPGRVYVIMSEAATRAQGSFKQQGEMKIQGDVKFE